MKAKLVLGLVFVVVISCLFSLNYLLPVKADNLSFSETFDSTVKRDSVATTARWDVAAGTGRLYGQEWTNMDQNVLGFENISDSADNSVNFRITIGSDNTVYAIWEKQITPGSDDIFFSKHTQGIGWTNMAGNLGADNISDTSAVDSTWPVLALDSNNNPYIVWSEVSLLELRFRRWNDGTNTWTDMAGGADYEVLSGHLSYADLKIDSNDNVYIVSEGLPALYFSTWSGSSWVGLTGSANYDNLSTSAKSRPVMALDVNGYPNIVASDFSDWYFIHWNGSAWVDMSGNSGVENISNTSAVNWQIPPILFLNSNDRPYFAWIDILDGDNDIYFTHWNGSSWSAMSGGPANEDISATSPGNSVMPNMYLDALNNPYLVWQEAGNDIYFKRWNGSAWVNLAGGAGADNVSNNAGISQRPALIVNSNSELFLTWADYTTGGGDIYLVRGENGSTWNDLQNSAGLITNLTADAGESKFSQTIIPSNFFKLGSDGKFYLVWQTKIGANYVGSLTKIIPDYQLTGVLQSANINIVGDYIVRAKMSVTDTVGAGQAISYFLSNDGGLIWKSAAPDTWIVFDASHDDLRWKAELSTTDIETTPFVDDLSIIYKTRKFTCSLNPLSLSQSQTVTISAQENFGAGAVWATIEKNGTVLDTVNLSGGGGNWNYDYSTSDLNLGENNVAVFATDGADTYVCNPSTGADWQRMSRQDIPWDRRYAHKSISYNNYLYVMGGVENKVVNDIWYSNDNGTNWIGPKTAAWSPRGYFGLVNFQNKLWLLGGAYFEDTANDSPSVTTYNDVWTSDDGLTWTAKPSAPWVGRFGLLAIVYDNRIWLAGGYDYLSASYKDDVWSYDGTTWFSEPNLPSARYGFDLAVWDEDGSGPEPEKLWMLAGRSPAGRQEDVWSYDSISGWVCVAGADLSCLHPVPAWGTAPVVGDGRFFHHVLVFDDPNDSLDTPNMYIMGGQTIVSGNEYNFNDVWVTTTADANPGADWSVLSDEEDYYLYNAPASSWPSWSGRRNFAATVHNDKMWVMGGYEITARSTWNDVWYSDNGSDWTIIGNNYGAPFMRRFGTQMAHLDPDGPLGVVPDKLYVISGATTKSYEVNDVWSSVNGTDWICEYGPTGCLNAAPAWAGRVGHQVVNYNNKLYMIGGCTDAGSYCLGYCSENPTKRCSNGVYSWNRVAISNCGVGEGICLSATLNDVWSYDGNSWASETVDANFIGRYYSSVTVFDNGTGSKMWLTGGEGFGRCFGGTEVGAICDATNYRTNPGVLPATYAPACDGGGTCSNICYGGSNRGLACTLDSQCPGGICGGLINKNYLSDIYASSDGVDWFGGHCSLTTATLCNDNGDCPGGETCAGNKGAWSGRNFQATIAYNDGTGEKLYLSGGWGFPPTPQTKKDTWSTSDGYTWTLIEDTPPWLARYTQHIYNYDDKLLMTSGNTFLVGSRGFLPALWTNEVWGSLNGADWDPITTSAAFWGRDFFAATEFKNRMWLAGGDSSSSGMSDVWASTYDFSNMTFTVGNLPGPSGLPIPMSPGDVSTACEAVDLLANDATSKAINWNFHDNATDELGFKLFSLESGVETEIMDIDSPNLTRIQEPNLATNEPYTRLVRSYNIYGLSGATDPATCYTLANRPKPLSIIDVTDDSITIKLDPNDGNPPSTPYLIRVISGLDTNYLLPDGSLSLEEAWFTYDEFGGANGVKVWDEIKNVNASAVSMALTSDQNYSFSAKAKNGDNIETAFSDSLEVTPGVGTAPEITAVKGVAVNLVWHNTFGLFTTAWAGNNLLVDLSEPWTTTLRAFSWLLNIALLILLIMLGLSLFQTIKNLKKINKYSHNLQLIWSILSQQAHHTYAKFAPQSDLGIYNASAYHQHKKLHNLTQNTFKGVVVVSALKLLVLGAVITGLINLNHSSLAQTAPYNQNGSSVSVGDTLSYIIEINNNGAVSAQDVVITDILNNNLSYLSGSAQINKDNIFINGGVNFDANSNNLSFDLGSLSFNESAYIVFKALVKNNAEGQSIVNQAIVSGSNFTDVASNPVTNNVTAAAINLNLPPVPPQPPVIPVSVCGNGLIETGEACDLSACNDGEQCANCQCLPLLPETTNENINQPPGPPPIGPAVTEPIIPIIGPIIDSITEIFEFLAQIEPFKSLNEIILDNPQVEQASQNVVTPILITVAAINVLSAVMFSTLYLLPFLHLLFLEPLLIIFGKKRKKWGVVYNSLTKKPIDLALVRLYRKNDNRLIQTRVTDRDGRFILIAKETGNYYLSVTKPGFISPSTYLRNEKQDLKYLDLYHGEVLEVTEKNAVLTPNIPLDPAEQKALALGQILRSYFLKNLRLIISYIGMILAVIVVIIIPNVITVGCLLLHVLLFLIFRRLIVPPKPKSWGIVYDDKNKSPLSNSVVRIFDLKFNKLLETQVTDSKGRYSFLVGKNEYQLLAEKPGYKPKEVKPVDLVNKEEIVNLDVGLNKA